MKDVKSAISRNLAALRREKGVTQAELAERFNYSDKAISRWEHGDTLPDINVLCELCEFYGITLNDLISEECRVSEKKQRSRDSMGYRIWLCIMCGSVVWLIATIIFVYTLTIREQVFWTVFVFAIPVSCLAVTLTGRNNFNGLVMFILQSVIMWTTLASVYFHWLVYNFWLVFLVGIPLELILFLRYKLKQYQ